MTTLHELNKARQVNGDRTMRAEELERAAANVDDCATRNPAATLRDLYERRDPVGCDRQPGSVHFGYHVDRARIVDMTCKAVEPLVPLILQAVARSLRAEAVGVRNEAEAAALLLRAALGADWNDKPEPKAD